MYQKNNIVIFRLVYTWHNALYKLHYMQHILKFSKVLYEIGIIIIHVFKLQVG